MPGEEGEPFVSQDEEEDVPFQLLLPGSPFILNGVISEVVKGDDMLTYFRLHTTLFFSSQPCIVG